MVLQGRRYMCRNQQEQQNDRGSMYVLRKIQDDETRFYGET